MIVEEAIAEARESWLARTAYWYNAVTAPDDLKNQIEAELGEADTDADAALRRIALAAYESMPCYDRRGWWGDPDDCMEWAAKWNEEHPTAPQLKLCDRCQKVQEYSA